MKRAILSLVIFSALVGSLQTYAFSHRLGTFDTTESEFADYNIFTCGKLYIYDIQLNQDSSKKYLLITHDDFKLMFKLGERAIVDHIKFKESVNHEWRPIQVTGGSVSLKYLLEPLSKKYEFLRENNFSNCMGTYLSL